MFMIMGFLIFATIKVSFKFLAQGGGELSRSGPAQFGPPETAKCCTQLWSASHRGFLGISQLLHTTWLDEMHTEWDLHSLVASRFNAHRGKEGFDQVFKSRIERRGSTAPSSSPYVVGAGADPLLGRG